MCMQLLWIKTSDLVAPLVCNYTKRTINYFCEAMTHARFIYCESTHNIYMFKHSYDICGHTHNIPRRIYTIPKLFCFVVLSYGSICLISSTELRHWDSHVKAQHYVWGSHLRLCCYPNSKVHGAYKGPTWGRQDPGGPHVGSMILAVWVAIGITLPCLQYQGEICFGDLCFTMLWHML